jgi:hypothetical protein
MLPSIFALATELAERYAIPAVRVVRERVPLGALKSPRACLRAAQLALLNALARRNARSTRHLFTTDRFVGFMCGGALDAKALRRLIAVLPAQQFTSYLRTFALNLDELLRMRLGELFGALVIAFFAFSLLHLYQRGRRYEIVLILGFIGFGLAGPLLHNVVIRHILVIAPIVLLVAGIGVVHLSGLLLEQRKATYPRAHLLAATLCLLAITSWAVPLRGTFYPPPTTPNTARPNSKRPSPSSSASPPRSWGGRHSSPGGATTSPTTPAARTYASPTPNTRGSSPTSSSTRSISSTCNTGQPGISPS